MKGKDKEAWIEYLNDLIRRGEVRIIESLIEDEPSICRPEPLYTTYRCTFEIRVSKDTSKVPDNTLLR